MRGRKRENQQPQVISKTVSIFALGGWTLVIIFRVDGQFGLFIVFYKLLVGVGVGERIYCGSVGWVGGYYFWLGKW